MTTTEARQLSKIESMVAVLQSQVAEIKEHNLPEMVTAITDSNGRLKAVERLAWLAVGGVGVLMFGIPIIVGTLLAMMR